METKCLYEFTICSGMANGQIAGLMHGSRKDSQTGAARNVEWDVNALRNKTLSRIARIAGRAVSGLVGEGAGARGSFARSVAGATRTRPRNANWHRNKAT